MNATSMETGRRIIVTPVETGSEGGTAGKALFTDTYSLHELLCAPYPGPLAVVSQVKRSPKYRERVSFAVPSGRQVRGHGARICRYPAQHCS